MDIYFCSEIRQRGNLSQERGSEEGAVKRRGLAAVSRSSAGSRWDCDAFTGEQRSGCTCCWDEIFFLLSFQILLLCPNFAVFCDRFLINPHLDRCYPHACEFPLLSPFFLLSIRVAFHAIGQPGAVPRPAASLVASLLRCFSLGSLSRATCSSGQ